MPTKTDLMQKVSVAAEMAVAPEGWQKADCGGRLCFYASGGVRLGLTSPKGNVGVGRILSWGTIEDRSVERLTIRLTQYLEEVAEYMTERE